MSSAAPRRRNPAAAKALAEPPAATPPARRGYGGRSPEAMDAERRRRLLDTALELFATQGYARTPIEQLCAESRVTARYFYQLFSSREALLKALYDEIIARTRASTLAALLQPDPDLMGRIDRAVAAFIEVYVQDPRCARICVLEAVGVSPAMEAHRRATIHAFAGMVEQFVAQLVAARLLPARDYHLISVALVGATNELLAEWLTVTPTPSIERLIDELQQLFRAVVRGGAELGSGAA
jgi:AcrR family transcriptional regulator